MINSHRFTLACLVAAMGACAGASGDADPGSTAALRSAPPFDYGTTCTKVERSHYGSHTTVNEVRMCMPKSDCGSAEASSATAYAGGLEWSGSYTFKDVKWFEGTCANRKPVSCDGRAPVDECAACAYSKCCPRVAMCDDDPNCVAIRTCMAACGKDVACITRCAKNAETGAYANFYAAFKCTVTSCSDTCSL